VSINAADLRAELKRLRRDEGRTLVKLLASPTIRAALGDPSEGRLLEQFDAAVLQLGNDLRSLALKNAFAIGMREPAILKTRRETFGAQEAVERGPDTIVNWENEKLEELVARLLAGGQRRQDEHLLVVVAITGGVITVVAEGLSLSGTPERHRYNPVGEPFIHAFIYQLPPYAAPNRLTIAGLFLDQPPGTVYAEATGDLLGFCCGDGRQRLDVVAGGIPGIEAAAHVAVHWDKPQPGVFFGLHWRPQGLPDS